MSKRKSLGPETTTLTIHSNHSNNGSL